MSAAFTPGPWDFDSTDFEVYDMESGESLDITEANARLITAAPELLDALKNLLDREWQDDEEALTLRQARSQARAAIAKATGVAA